MAKFLTDLGKGFIKSAVNQVGRDGGRVVSNRVYGDKHSMPIRSVSKQIGGSTVQVEEYVYDESLQPPIRKPQPVLYVLRNCLKQLIPFFSLYYIIKGIQLLTKKKENIYTKIPVYVQDRRYSSGRRLEGYQLQKTHLQRDLSTEEIESVKFKGFLTLFSVVFFFLLIWLLSSL